MQYRSLGSSNINASVIGLGTWALGGFEWGTTEDATAISAIHAALDAGINLIDTAPIYGFGRSEELVGRALADRRDRAVLATKCGLRWDRESGQFSFEDADGNRIYRYLARDGIREEIEHSLRRLQTDHIDLYQTHWQDETTPIADTMAALLELRQEGKIRAIGVSNVTPDQLATYREGGEIASAQEQFSMLDQQHVGSLFAACRQAGVAMLAYSPLAMGLLTGKIGPERTFPADDVRSSSPRFSVESREKVAELLSQLQPFADAHGLTIAQLVINWSAESTAKGVTHVLCGARTPEQAIANATGGGEHLSAAEVVEIDSLIEAAGLAVPPVFG
jgi:methylglyoxal reductase